MHYRWWENKITSIRKSVIGSNIHIEVNEFDSLWIVFWNDSGRFGFSTRSLAHVMSGHFPRRKTSRDQLRNRNVLNRFKTWSKMSQIHSLQDYFHLWSFINVMEKLNKISITDMEIQQEIYRLINFPNIIIWILTMVETRLEKTFGWGRQHGCSDFIVTWMHK